MAYLAKINYANMHQLNTGSYQICPNSIYFVNEKKQICVACGKWYKNTHKKYKHKNILIDNLSEDFFDSF